jgi:hypothetical protein
MDATCRVPLEDMTPKPTTTKKLSTYRSTNQAPTNSMTSLAMLLKVTALDLTTPPLITMPKSSLLPSTRQGSTAKLTMKSLSQPTRNPTTYDVHVVTNKLKKDLEWTPKSTPAEYHLSPTQKMEGAIDVPSDVPWENNFQISSTEENNTLNCDTKLGNARNHHCGILQAQSSSSTNQISLMTLLSMYFSVNFALY